MRTIICSSSVTLLLSCFLEVGAIAQSIEDYCISRVGPAQEKTTPYTLPNPWVGVREIVFEGTPYSLSADGDSVLLLEEGRSRPLSQILVSKYDNVTEFTLNESGWLWVDARAVDFMAFLDLERPRPSFSSPISSPALAQDPCPWMTRFFVGCDYAQSTYSQTLDRAFAKGYPPSFWGWAPMQAFEMVEGEVLPLPKEMLDMHLVKDVASPKGAIFRRPSQEAFFYDGKIITPLLPPMPLPSPTSSTAWRTLKTMTDRVFLTDITHPTDNPFLAEVIEGPMLERFTIPDDLMSQRIKLVQERETSPLWAFTERRLFLASTSNHLDEVLVMPDSSYLYKVQELAESSSQGIALIIKNKEKDTLTEYHLLRQNHSSAHCDIPVSAKHPPILE